MSTTTAHNDHGVHVLSIRTNVMIFLALLALLVLTIAISYVDLGPLGIPIAMAIACAKALLIVLYFMHVRYSNPIVWLFAGAAFFWLFILLGLTFNDYLFRGSITLLGK